VPKFPVLSRDAPTGSGRTPIFTLKYFDYVDFEISSFAIRLPSR
jgi:hypothetical protein